MKIGLLGFGVVGKAAEAAFRHNYEIAIFDKYLDYLDFDNLLTSDCIFIMVPTPFDCQKNRVDDSAVIESLERLANKKFLKPVIIKSTVPPGSCDNYSSMFNLELVFNPEFLRESTTPNEDFANQDTIVIGTEKKHIFQLVKELYLPVAVSKAKFFHTTFIEAEVIKCAQNTMLASRVALANIIFDSCTDFGVEYNRIKEIAFDRFEILGPHMVAVPGPDGKRGFGGKCLPKDIRAFSSVHESDLLNKIISYNDNLRDDLDKFLVNYQKSGKKL